MIDWIKSLFCMHKYVTVNEEDMFGETWQRVRGRIGKVYVCRCEKCGRLKSYTFTS